MPDVLGVFREPEFSPGRVDDDVAILERTAHALERCGLEVRLGTPDAIESAAPRVILAMCQSEPALAALDAHAGAIPVINPPAAIRNCFRVATVRLLRARGLPFPRTVIVPTSRAAVGAAPCWVKRGDVHATEPGDVVFAASRRVAAEALAAFAARGVAHAALQDHVEGTVVKFYGIADGRFFRAYTDAPELPASISTLWEAAHAGAVALGLEVFGGDCVVPASGGPVLIDVNDWPSFARCRDEAAEAIASYVCERLAGSRAAPRTRMGVTRHAGQTGA